MSVTVPRCTAAQRSTHHAGRTRPGIPFRHQPVHAVPGSNRFFHHCMPDWETFAVVTGGVAGALVGLFFVAVSIQTQKIMRSIEGLKRADQVLVDFAVVMLTAILMSVPSQSTCTLVPELSALGLVFGILLELLDRRA